MSETTHDPRREVEGLRDHLASHDKPLAFLIGAGASCSVQDGDGTPLIPSLTELGQTCERSVEALGTKHKDAYDLMLREQRDVLKRLPTVEDMLSNVRDKLAAMGPSDSLGGLNRAQLEAVERTIRETIASAARPSEDRIPRETPHHSVARWLRRIDRRTPVELFTTNYDTLIERALEDERVEVFDGFVGSRRPFFSPSSLTQRDCSPPLRWSRLWKVHGSINWHRTLDDDQRLRITREHEHTGGELIYPSSHKYDDSRKQPYVAMLEHLGRVLSRAEETVMITIGYSFGDQHINGVIFDALDERKRTHVVSLQFGELPDEHELIRRARQRANLLVLGPATAVIRGSRAPWRLLEPVDDRTADLLDVPFDSDAEPARDVVGLGGKFRLGDFQWFGRFLEGVVGTHD